MRKYLRKNRKIRTAVSLAVSVVLSVAIFLLFLCIELWIGYFSTHLFQESIRISGYATKMEEEMLNRQKELFASYGLPENLTEEIWGESKAYLAFHQYMESGERKQDAEDFGQQEVLEAYLKGQGVYETEGVQNVLENVVSESKAICRRYLYPSFIGGYQQFVQERKPVFAAIMAISVLIGVLAAVFLFCCYHSGHHALYYITGSFFTAAVWNLAAAITVRTGGWFFPSDTKSSFYLEFLNTFKDRGMYPWYVVCVTAAAFTVLLLLVSIQMRNRK